MTDEERMKKIDEFLDSKDKSQFYKRCKICNKVMTINDGGYNECEFCRMLIEKENTDAGV